MKSKYFQLTFISVFLGNLFEHYDLALYSLLSPFFASIFFPQQDPLFALFLTYAIIPIGALTRLIGAFVFGYVGDKYGRKKALFISLLGLGIVSISLACSPTYETVGWIAPIYLATGRMFQNFFGIGESLGGGIYVLEQADSKDQDIMSSIYSSSTVGGFLLASLGVSFLCAYNILETHWRLLYLIGGATSFFGCLLRTGLLSTSPLEPPLTVGIKENFYKLWEQRHLIALIACVSGLSYASASIGLVFLNGFAPLIAGVSKQEMVYLNTLLLLIDLMILPIFGLLAKKTSREKLMLFSAILTSISCLPLFIYLERATFFEVVVIRMVIVCLSASFTASFHAWAKSLTPQSHRYTFISFGYALGSQVLGGPIAPFTLWAYQLSNSLIWASFYWMLLAFLVSALLIMKMLKREGIKAF